MIQVPDRTSEVQKVRGRLASDRSTREVGFEAWVGLVVESALSDLEVVLLMRRRSGYGYVILGEDDDRLVRHDSFDVAINEANRLSRVNPGKRFTVYRPAQTHRLRDVEIEEHQDEQDVPF